MIRKLPTLKILKILNNRKALNDEVAPDPSEIKISSMLNITTRVSKRLNLSLTNSFHPSPMILSMTSVVKIPMNAKFIISKALGLSCSSSSL